MLLVLLPSLWLARNAFENALVVEELSRLRDNQRRWAEQLDDRFSEAEASVSRFGRLLTADLTRIQPSDATAFDALTRRDSDGSLRSRRETFRPESEAGIWLQPTHPDTPRERGLFLRGKRLVDLYGKGALADFANTWILPRTGGEVIFWPSEPTFVYSTTPDLDYTATDWVTLASPERNPSGAARWTPTSFDPTPKKWMISVVAPFFDRGVWAGSVGHDMVISTLARRLREVAPHSGSQYHLIRSDGTLLVSSSRQERIETSQGTATLADLGDTAVTRVMLALQSDSLGPTYRIAPDPAGQRYLIASHLSRPDWYVVVAVTRAEILAAARENEGQFWLYIAGALLLLSIVPALVVARVVIPQVNHLVRDTARVSDGDLSVRFRPTGTSEFRRIAHALNEMVHRIESTVEDLRSTHDALTKSEAMNREILETVAEAIIAVDARGLIRSWNRAATTIFGHEVAQIVGEPVSRLGPSFSFAVLAQRAADLEGRLIDPAGTTGGRRNDGSDFPVEVTVRRTGSGPSVGLTMTVRDLTRQRSDEIATGALADQLRQAQKMDAVGQLAGGVAHDFNNMLTVIRGYAESALEDVIRSTPAEASDLEEIIRAAERATGLTRQLLVFGRKYAAESQLLDLNEAVTQLSQFLDRLLEEHIETIVEPAPDLPPILSDPVHIEQIIVNLAVNARDAMPNGGRLRLRTAFVRIDSAREAPRPLVPDGEYVTLSVTDSGIGMHKEILGRIFDPFFTTKPVGSGTGLGLSTTYGIVREAGGDITVESTPGVGSTFTVFLPAQAGAAVLAQRPRAAEQPRGRETVLVVEDEDSVLRLVRTVLQGNGYRVLTASGGREGLAIANTHPEPIHLVLTDVMMPEMNGKAMVERLLEQRPDLRVILMSGYAGDALASRGIEFDGMGLLAKPFSMRALLQQVRESLDAPRPRRSGAVAHSTD